MFRLIKQAFIVLFRFSGSLTTKCVPLNNETCMIKTTIIDLNLVSVNLYRFMISLDKFYRSCNAVDECLQRYVFKVKLKT